MSMTSRSAQEEGRRAFVEAAEQPEPTTAPPILLPKPIKTPVFRSGESVSADRRESIKRDDSVSESNRDKDNNNSNGKDPFAFAFHKRRMRKQKCAHKASKRLFDGIAKSLVEKHNTRLKKGHLWPNKRIDPGYGWKIQVVRDATAFPPPMPTTPEKFDEADLLNILDWMVPPVHHSYNLSKAGEYTAQHKLPSKYQNDNHFKQKSLLNHGKAQVPSTAKPLGIVKATNILNFQRAPPHEAPPHEAPPLRAHK
eukprot:jgi/Psemu1/17308/gm1.17308_g